MKKILAAILLVALTFTLSCKKSENELLIGEFGSLTGTTATFGQSTHNGVMLATEEINEAGGLLGKKVKIISMDNRSLAEEVKTVVLKLIKQYDVLALIGEVASS